MHLGLIESPNKVTCVIVDPCLQPSVFVDKLNKHKQSLTFLNIAREARAAHFYNGIGRGVS